MENQHGTKVVRRPTTFLTRRPITNKLALARKFIQTLDDQKYQELTKFADQRGVTIQGLIRAVIVPDWITAQETLERKSLANTLTVVDHSEPETRSSESVMVESKNMPLVRR